MEIEEIEKIENFELEKKVKIYRKCITLVLSDDFDIGLKYMIEGIIFRAEEILDICNYVIDLYGNPKEIAKFYSTFECLDAVVLKKMISL